MEAQFLLQNSHTLILKTYSIRANNSLESRGGIIKELEKIKIKRHCKT